MKDTDRRPSITYILSEAAFCLILCFCAFIMLEISDADPRIPGLITADVRIFALNILTAAAVLFAVRFFTPGMTSAACIFSVFIYILSVVNYFTVRYHGSPLSPLEISNLGTAVNVIGDYSFHPDRSVAVMSFLFGAMILLVVLHAILGRKLLPGGRITYGRRGVSFFIFRICIAAFVATVLFAGYFSRFSPIPRDLFTWKWTQAYYDYGYLPCTVRISERVMDPVPKPEGYSAKKTGALDIEVRESSGSRPDIIFILNESYYDLRLLRDIETDVPFLANYDDSDDYIRPYVFAPSSGGGTNSAEYEFLFGNSAYLLGGATPFNTLMLSGRNSLVRLLNDLGYDTMGAHCGPKGNYMRSAKYPEMGFDRIAFGGDFIYKKTILGRKTRISDDAAFRTVEEWYDEAVREDPDSPKFIYLLTMQNHGGWDSGVSERDDAVHLTEDEGGINVPEVEEYLSCIRATDEAFRALADHFKDSERDVIICMAGDHCPTFAVSLRDADVNPEVDTDTLIHMTPGIVWSNFALKEELPERISLFEFGASVLAAADVQLDAYYSYIADMSKKWPVLFSYGRCIDAKGEMARLDMRSETPRELADYIYMEYETIGGRENFG